MGTPMRFGASAISPSCWLGDSHTVALIAEQSVVTSFHPVNDQLQVLAAITVDAVQMIH
jgi:hypothetical protein